MRADPAFALAWYALASLAVLTMLFCVLVLWRDACYTPRSPAVPDPTTLPDALLAELNAAEAALQAAAAKDVDARQARAASDAALAATAQADADALAAHQDGNAAATKALADLKAHFGVP